MDLRQHYFRTEGDGVLDVQDTGPEQLAALVDAASQAPHIVLHIHGGLVSAKSGIAKAARLAPYYQQHGYYGVFPVWETGILETIPNNLREIANEKIFDVLVKKLLKWALGKLAPGGGARTATGLALPNDLELAKELRRRKESQLDPTVPEPYASVVPTGGAPLAPQEEGAFVTDLTTDPAFQQEVNAIVNGASPVPNAAGARSATQRASTATLMSPEVVDEMEGERARATGLAAVKLALRAAKVLAAVVRRVRSGRDHGLYTTVVEEVLRELYLANVGAGVWKAMKDDAAQTFMNYGNAPERGGWLFFKLLAERMAAGRSPKLSIVAHSAGSIYACHLLAHLAEARAQNLYPLAQDFALENLILLAPAVDTRLFARTLAEHQALFRRFRMFSLSDALESGYWEVPGIYPRSLLYLVSGVFERETLNGQDESSAFDLPILGMQRFLQTQAVFEDAATDKVRAYLSGEADRTVWSEVQAGQGLSSDAIRHGAFDMETERMATMRSVIELLGEP